MIEGIEILNKTPIMIPNNKFLLFGFIITIIACIVGYIETKINVENERLSYITITVFGLCLFAILVMAILYKEVKIPSDRYQYEAIIQDDVSINEVYKHYDVIEKKGKKWILGDKEK